MTAIAIDGPTGAGKSTIARRTAQELGFIYVDTGALYRAIGLSMLRRGIDLENPAAVESALDEIRVFLRFQNGEQRVMLGNEDVSDQIRTAEVSMAASRVSAVPAVREFLFQLQRDMAKSNNVIMDGRDIGTVVLPNAQVKIFLTASPEIRARRRFEEMIAKGMQTTYEDVLSDLQQRDYNDTHRAIAPLKAASDSITLDTSGDTFDQAVERVLALIKSRISADMHS